MNSVRTTSVLLAVFCVFAVVPPATAYDVHSGLRVFPYEGRPGSTFYVSGFGMLPLTRLYILLACPNFQQAKPENIRIIPAALGPKTNSAGQFSGWRMKVPHLAHVVSSGCSIYAQDNEKAGQSFGPTNLGDYYILGPRDKLQPCDVRICVAITPTPKRVKPGRVENVDVQAWAGALAGVTVSYPGYPPVTQTVKLDWNGSGRAHVPVPANMQDASHVRITVHCRLGRITGNRKAEFTVVH